MPSLSAEQKAKLLATTKPAAAAFIEDMEYIRDVIARIETSRGELRRLSAVLRRFLVEGDISKIAAPRLGRVKLLAPDNKPFYDAERHLWFPFFASGGATVFGLKMGAMAMMNAGQASQNPAEQARLASRFLDKHDSETRIELRIDNFVAQRVLCYMRRWVSRKEAIKYVANVASGVHSGAPETEEDRLIERMRAACSCSVQEGRIRLHVLPELGPDSFDTTVALKDREFPLSFTPASLDPVLVEMLAAAQFLAVSPGISLLEDAIRSEFDSLNFIGCERPWQRPR